MAFRGCQRAVYHLSATPEKLSTTAIKLVSVYPPYPRYCTTVRSSSPVARRALGSLQGEQQWRATSHRTILASHERD